MGGDGKQWPGSPAEAEWHASATLYQRCRDTQPRAALTGVPWGWKRRDSPQRAGALLTTRALYYLNSEQPPRWRRISWTDIADLQWHTDTHTLTVTGPPGAPTDHATIHLTGPANLIDTAHDLINTTTIATHPVDRGATHQGATSARQRPPTN